MMGKKLLSFLFALALAINFAKGVEPVTVVVSLTPPYSPFLHEYASSGINKLQVTLIVNDSRLVNYPARLQMVIEKMNSGIIMRTSDYAAIPPILLNGHSTEVLQGADLTAYFMAQNNVFQGSLQAQYIQTGRIPDGQYRIGFRVVDAQRTEVALSNTIYSQPAWFVLNDPPQLNLPRQNTTETVKDPQSIKLEWFPRHLGSMNSAFSTNYKVELFAIRVPGMEPNQVAMSMQPDYTEVTGQTKLFLTNDRYMLEPGVKYAWRVKAYAEDGFTLFQNNGYSEVFSFTYGNSCPTPQNVNSQIINSEQVKINWDTDPSHTSYQVRYRAAWEPNAPWHTSNSYFDNVSISNMLMPDHKYEYQVMANCNKTQSDYSRLSTFNTPAPPLDKFTCGNTDNVVITNHNPKQLLSVGEIIYNGKFPVKVTEVHGSGGVFSGKGRMRIPFLNYVQVNMQFTGITVNELNQVTGGEMASIYNPDSKFLVDVNLPSKENGQNNNPVSDNKVESEVANTITIKSPVDTILKRNNGDIQIISTNGDTTTIHNNSDGTRVAINQSGDTTSLSKGNVSVIDQNGNIVWQTNTTQEVVISHKSTADTTKGVVKIMLLNKLLHDKDTIFVTHANFSNTPIEILKDSVRIPFDSITWTGLTKVDSLHVNISNVTKTGKIITGLYKGKSFTISLKLNEVTFYRLGDGPNGNVYGYDDYDMPNNVNLHHISVEKNKTTYLGISFKDTSTIKLSVDPFNIANCIIKRTGSYVLEINAFATGGEATIAATSKDGSDTLAKIKVNVYELKTTSGNVYGIYDNTYEAPISLVNSSAIKDSTNKILKYGVVQSSFNGLNNLPINYDLNGNHKLDLFFNIEANWTQNYEMATLYNDTVVQNSNNILICRSPEQHLYYSFSYLKDTTIADSTRRKIFVGPVLGNAIGSGASRGFTIGDTYYIESPRGADRDTFILRDIRIERRLFVLIIDKPLKHDHPIDVINQFNSHYISWPTGSPYIIAGLSANYSGSTRNGTILFNHYTGTEYYARIIAHEQLHGRTLQHVVDNDNIMYFTIGADNGMGGIILNPLNKAKPLRHKIINIDLPNTKGNPGRTSESQWEQIKR